MAGTESKIFKGYVRISDPDYDRLADLIMKAKGSRTFAEFSELCEVNPVTFSRIINHKNTKPCRDKLILAIYEHADPQSGVTLGELLEAHGLAADSFASSQAERVDLYWKTLSVTSAISQVSSILVGQMVLHGEEVSQIKDQQSFFQLHLQKKSKTEDKKTDCYYAMELGNVHSCLERMDGIFKFLYLNGEEYLKSEINLVVLQKEAFEKIRQLYLGVKIPHHVDVLLVDRQNQCIIEKFTFSRIR